MKQKIFPYVLALSMFASNMAQASAASLVAGALEPTQWLNQIQLLVGNASAGITAGATNLTNIKVTILDPVGNVLIAIAQQKAALDILSWANGGFQGKNSLIIGNPDKFASDKGLNTVKVLLGGVDSGSSYGNSILGTITNSVKYGDPSTQLASLSQSAIPSLVQKDLCDEATLNNTARYDVTDDNGNVDPAAFAARKKELYNRLCVGDPNKDKRLAQTLTAVNKQNPSIGGWDTWLATTGGDNQYEKSVQAALVVNRAQEAKQQSAAADLARGGGVASQTKCVKKAADGVSCADEQVVTPSGVAEKSLSGSVTAGLDRLNNIQGSGALSALLTGFATKFIMSGINNALSGVLSNSSSQSTTVSTSTSKASYTQDLKNDPETKKAIINPMQKLFTSTTASLMSLKSLDDSYLNSINAYETKVDGIKLCYDALVLADPTLDGSPKVVTAINFYNDRKGRIQAIQNEIRPEIGLIGDALMLIVDTSNEIRNSNSTQEISSIFNNYQDQIDKKGFPTVSTEAQRRGEYARSKNDVQGDLSPSGEYTSIKAAGPCPDVEYVAPTSSSIR